MLHLICTLDDSRIDWLPQFLPHYRELGVDQMHLSLHFGADTSKPAIRERTERASDLARRFGAGISAVLACVYDTFMLREHHDRMQERIRNADDWIVWADIDEFQVYPALLPGLIEDARRDRADYFKGVFIDRTTQDGSLKVFDPAESIWSQFPRQSHITRDLTTACTEKIVCARSAVRLEPGNHDVCDRSLRRYEARVEVHHFKWDASVIRRLQHRVTPYWQEHCPWWEESRDFLSHIDRNNGKLPVWSEDSDTGPDAS